jgi:hypothetical protein
MRVLRNRPSALPLRGCAACFVEIAVEFYECMWSKKDDSHLR